MAEPLGDEATVATSRCYYGATLLVTREVDRGTELARLGAEAAARLGLYPLCAESLSVLAISYAVAGDSTSEREMHVARLAVAREHGDVARTADAWASWPKIALDEADAVTARTYAEEALAIAHPALPMEARDAMISLARAAIVDGDLAGAATHARPRLRGRGEDRSETGGRAVLPRGRLPCRCSWPRRRRCAALRRRPATRALTERHR